MKLWFYCGLAVFVCSTFTAQAEEPADIEAAAAAVAAIENETAGAEASPTVPGEEGKANEAKPQATAGGEPGSFMTKGERQRLKKQAEIAEERSEETSPIKQKAIEKAREREERQKELQKQKEEASTSFRKKALERAEERAKEDKKKLEEIENRKSRFSELAKKRAEERARKAQEKLERRNRRNK